MSYFSKFPTTIFKGQPVADITRKASLLKVTKSDALSYMNYTIQEGERPEEVAYFYYDSTDYTWLVLASNDIVDPYTEWPKSIDTLEQYIISKYASQSKATGQSVIEWTKNTSLGANIKYYASYTDPTIKLNRASYLSQDENEKAEFYPVRVYDYESMLNEQRRNIVLVNKSYLADIDKQLGPKLNAD